MKRLAWRVVGLLSVSDAPRSRASPCHPQPAAALRRLPTRPGAPCGLPTCGVALPWCFAALLATSPAQTNGVPSPHRAQLWASAAATAGVSVSVVLSALVAGGSRSRARQLLFVAAGAVAAFASASLLPAALARLSAAGVSGAADAPPAWWWVQRAALPAAAAAAAHRPLLAAAPRAFTGGEALLAATALACGASAFAAAALPPPRAAAPSFRFASPDEAASSDLRIIVLALCLLPLACGGAAGAGRAAVLRFAPRPPPRPRAPSAPASDHSAAPDASPSASAAAAAARRREKGEWLPPHHGFFHPSDADNGPPTRAVSLARSAAVVALAAAAQAAVAGVACVGYALSSSSEGAAINSPASPLAWAARFLASPQRSRATLAGWALLCGLGLPAAAAAAAKAGPLSWPTSDDAFATPAPSANGPHRHRRGGGGGPLTTEQKLHTHFLASSQHPPPSPPPTPPPSPSLPLASVVMRRKAFHVAATLAFAPALLLDPDVLSLGAAAALCLLVAAEAARVANDRGRVARLWASFGDARDKTSSLVLSPASLLLGLAAPVWLTSMPMPREWAGAEAATLRLRDDGYAPVFKRTAAPAVLAAWAGVAAVGAGDAAAGAVGAWLKGDCSAPTSSAGSTSTVHRARIRSRTPLLPGWHKSWEGSAAGWVATCGALAVARALSSAARPFAPAFVATSGATPGAEWARRGVDALALGGAALVASALEGVSSQNDNVVVPLALCALLTLVG